MKKVNLQWRKGRFKHTSSFFLALEAARSSATFSNNSLSSFAAHSCRWSKNILDKTICETQSTRRKSTDRITSKFLCKSDNFCSFTVCASSTIQVSLDACVSNVLKKFSVTLEMERVVSTVLECACNNCMKQTGKPISNLSQYLWFYVQLRVMDTLKELTSLCFWAYATIFSSWSFRPLWSPFSNASASLANWLKSCHGPSISDLSRNLLGISQTLPNAIYILPLQWLMNV